MKKELWVGIGVGGGAAAFTLIVSLIIQMSGDKDYPRAIAYSLLAGGGGFLAGSLGAFWALSDSDVNSLKFRSVSNLELPQPVQSLKVLGETAPEQWDSISRFSAATWPTPPKDLVALMDRVRECKAGEGQQSELELPLPAPQAQSVAIPMPVPAPLIDRSCPYEGEEALDEDLWREDSMSSFQEEGYGYDEDDDDPYA